MYVYSKPEEQVESYLEAAPTGLLGTVGVQVINTANGAVVSARKTTGITEIPSGSGAYYAKLTAPGSPGTYSIVWDTGVIGPDTTAADILVVNTTGVVPPSIPGENLISVSELRVAKGMPTLTTEQEEKFNLAIEWASEAVRKYTDRAFGKPLTTGVRIYDFEPAGFINIDDASAVESVEFNVGGFITPIDSRYWRVEPLKGPIFDSLDIPHWAGIYSPQMGFTYNLDVFSKERGWPGLTPTVLVKGTWGWPEVPKDVQRAVLVTAAYFAQDPSQHVSESIENYSYSTGGSRAFGAAENIALPGDAKELLAPYVRILV